MGGSEKEFGKLQRVEKRNSEKAIMENVPTPHFRTQQSGICEMTLQCLVLYKHASFFLPF
jgi:hypothetical protein